MAPPVTGHLVRLVVMGKPPPGGMSVSSSAGTEVYGARTWVYPLHAIGIGIVAANAETVGTGYVAAVEASNIARSMQIIAAHSRVCDDSV